jgi:hypothetical protein
MAHPPLSAAIRQLEQPSTVGLVTELRVDGACAGLGLRVLNTTSTTSATAATVAAVASNAPTIAPRVSGSNVRCDMV